MILNRSNRYMLFFWLGITIVLSLNFLVWLYVNQVEKTFESELKNRLLNISRLMNRLIDSERFNLLIPGEQNTLAYIHFQNLLESIRQENDLQSVILYSPTGDILVAAPELISLQKSSDFTGNTLFQKAKSGLDVVSGIERFADQNFMTAFSPVRDTDGYVTGLQIIEARANYFKVLDELRNRLLLFSSINLLLIILIALGLYLSIKQQLRYQADIKDREHLVQLGSMAATVAHEVRNPLSIIKGTNEVIQKKYGKPDDELFTYIPREIERLLTLIQEFLGFARSPDLNIKPVNIDVLFNRIQVGLTPEEQKKVTMNIESPVEMISDESLLEQAFLNILKNALQATTQSGQVNMNIHLLRKNQLSIEISDTGDGIQSQDLPKIFDPFFTTKESGTGLGLAIAKRLISRLGGEINIDSAWHKGTTVTVSLPLILEKQE